MVVPFQQFVARLLGDLRAVAVDVARYSAAEATRNARAAEGERANDATPLSVARRLRQLAEAEASGGDAALLSREVAICARQLAEWHDQRFGAPSAWQAPNKNRERIAAIIDKLGAVHDAILARFAPPEFAATAGDIAFGGAHASDGTVTVVTPISSTGPEALASIAAATRAENQTKVRILAVATGSPDAGLVARLRTVAAAGKLEFVEDATNRGFTSAVNAGLVRAAGDAVVLTPDTLVADHWVDRLAAVAASASDIASATPLSNAATFSGYPFGMAENPVIPGAGTASLAAMAWAANGTAAIPVPAGESFCLYLRKEALREIGPFDAETFDTGFCAVADWSMRARSKNWRHVAAPGVFVFHRGSASFAASGRAQRARAAKTLRSRRPEYAALVTEHVRADPLAPARRALDGERFRESFRPREKVIVHLLHRWGGGVEAHATDLALRQATIGWGAAILKIAGSSTVRLIFPGEYPNLSFDFAKSEDVVAFRRIVADDRATLHIHHVIELDASHLNTLMGCFADRVVTLHDYYFVCPQITLRDWAGNPCGVRPNEECDHCTAKLKPVAPSLKPVAAHRAAMAKVVAGARRVFTPSGAARDLLARGLGAIPITVAPHHDEGPIAPPRPATTGKRIVVTIGAFNGDKGALILAEVIRDAGERRLPLHFVLAGQATWRNPPKNVTMLGEYERKTIAEILVRVGGHVAFLPSIVAETYMFSLSECVRAGYFPVVFDLGAQAERVRQLGWGSVLPIGTGTQQIGDALVGIEIPTIAAHRIEEWLQRDRLAAADYYS